MLTPKFLCRISWFPRNFWDESWGGSLAYVKKKRAKRGWCRNKSKKCSNVAAETEDGVAGGAHAESFITQQKSLPPSIEVLVYILIKAFIGACFGPLESAIFTTQNKNGNERLQDMISPFVHDEDYHIRRGRLDCLFL